MIDWGLTEESPQHLGPFIIMDYVDGTRLSTLLKQPTENDQEDIFLNPDIDDTTLDIVYDQIAELSHRIPLRIHGLSLEGP